MDDAPNPADAFEVVGCDPGQLTEVLHRGLDHGGNPVEPFVDDAGGWPLRCCLTDSRSGDRLAVVAWSPFPWTGPYAETGPVVIHARGCAGRSGEGVPAQFLSRRQLLRPYGHDRRIAYDDIAVVEGDGSLPVTLSGLLGRRSVDFVLVRNVLSGCWSFTARRRRPVPVPV